MTEPTNPTPPRDDAPDAALIEIVEGINGAMNHGTWRDDHGNRLKDTPEWVAFYNAALRAHQPARVGVDDDTLIAAMMAIEEGEAQFGWFENWRESISDWKGEHCGDCTNVPMTCLRCTYDDAVKRLPDFSRILAALLPTEAGAEPVARQSWHEPTSQWIGTPEGWTAEDCKAWPDRRFRPLYATQPAAPTDNTALVDVAKELERWIADNAMPNSKIYGLLDKLSAALSRPAPQAVTVEEACEVLMNTPLEPSLASHVRLVVEEVRRALGGRT